MQEAVKLISENGIWVFLIGILTSIIIGAVKTPIRAKYVDTIVEGDKKEKAENLFDTAVFLSTYLVAILAAMVYYTISTKAFNLGEIFKLSLPIWLSQSIAYGAWKKLGIKRGLSLLAKLVFKDTDKSGEISIDEAISQVVKSIKDGKFGVEELVETVNDNLAEVVEETAKASEGTKEAELVKEVTQEGIDKVAEKIKKKAAESAKEIANTVIGKTKDGTEVSVNTQPIIKF